MSSCPKKSLTLIELLIAIGLLSVIILAISNIDLFTRFHTISADRRAKLQNDVSYALEHMTKQISRAIGNESTDGPRQVIDESDIGTDKAIRVHIDKNDNGRRDSPPPRPTNPTGDCWIAYRFTTGNQLQYCPQWCLNWQCTDAPLCTNWQCIDDGCTPAWGTVENTLSSKIASFTVTKPQDTDDPDCPTCLSENYVEIALTACWDPDGTPQACGTPDNPKVTMHAAIKMPSVSTH